LLYRDYPYLVNIIFVIVLTLYNWTNVDVKFAMLDSHWFAGEQINPDSEQFKSPTHLCGSFGETTVDGITVYTTPCLLTDLNCEDHYSDPLCPEEFSFCTNDLVNCAALGSFASVVYLEGDSFVVSFGSAQGMLIWVELVTLMLCLTIYYCCFKQDGISNLKAEVQALAASNFKRGE